MNAFPTWGTSTFMPPKDYECFHGNGQNSGIWNLVDLELVNQDAGHWIQGDRHGLGWMDGCKHPNRCQNRVGETAFLYSSET